MLTRISISHIFVLLLLAASCGRPADSLPVPSALLLTPTRVPHPLNGEPVQPSVPTPIFVASIDNLAIGGRGQLYASGYGNSGEELPRQQLAQWDGVKWVALNTAFQPAGNSMALDGAGRLYIEALMDSRQGLSNAILRWDGATWEDITGNFGAVVDALQPGRVSSNIPVVALAVDGEDNLYAAGAFFYPTAGYTAELPTGYVAKWDQEAWTVLGEGFDKVYILALAVSPSGEVYAAGAQPLTPEGSSSYIARWDGEKWRQIDTNKPESSGYLALDRSGGLYVASQSSEPSGYIHYWDGTDWKNITAQLAGEAPAILDIAVDVNDHVYIAGSFESVNGIPARYIAYWDGSLWHALGEGVNKQVDALAFDQGGDLYAAGYFTQAGGLPAEHIARWDGGTWHALRP